MGLDEESVVYYEEKYDNAKVAYHRRIDARKADTFYLIITINQDGRVY